MLQFIERHFGGGPVAGAVVTVEQAFHHLAFPERLVHDLGHVGGFHLDVEQIRRIQVDQGALTAKSMTAGLFDERLDVRGDLVLLNGGLEGPGNLVGPLGQAAGPQADPDHRPVRGGEQLGSESFPAQRHS